VSGPAAIVAFLLVMLAAVRVAPAAPPVADFVLDEADAATRTLSGATAEGHVSLSVQTTDPAAEGVAVTFEVQRARDAAFTDPVVHHDSAAPRLFVSGLADGVHHFRVRARAITADADADADADPVWGPWSEAVTFEVQHQSMALAWTLFGSGAFLFVALVVIIVRSAGDPRRGLDDEGVARA
jgi:hypothetical protein